MKLAGRKVATWRLRFHPKVRGLKFKEGVKRQERVNARVRFIEGDMDEVELNQWKANFDQVPEFLTAEEKAAFLKDPAERDKSASPNSLPVWDLETSKEHIQLENTLLN